MSCDWSGEHPESIEWAAFFSGCGHEVADLMSGNRVTLTYNMYAIRAAMPSPMRSVEIESFPLYWEIKAALKNKDFLVNGGTIGFFCNHFYAQNYHKSPEVLPQALKGIDMVVHAVACALRLPLNICPIMDKPWDFDDSIRRRDDEKTKATANSQREMERAFADIGQMALISETQMLDVPAEKEKIRYTPNSEEDLADPLQRKFEKKESLVGRKFKEFATHGSTLIGEDIPTLKVKTPPSPASCFSD
jgi:hypothetical protein